MLLVVQRIEPSKNELKHSLQVFRRWRCDKDVAEAVTMLDAIAIPRLADFPRPRPAVRLSVVFIFFSEILSTSCMTDEP